jgi:hypothetical protein
LLVLNICTTLTKPKEVCCHIRFDKLLLVLTKIQCNCSRTRKLKNFGDVCAKYSLKDLRFNFSAVVGGALAGNTAGMLVHGSSAMAFNAAPIDLLSIHFGSRDAELSRLHIIFSSQFGYNIQRCAIYGIPGVGKTQLALRYAKSTWGSRYNFIFWVSASTIEKLTQGFADLLNLVGHVDRNHPEQPARLTAARRWLEDCQTGTPKSWLLIVDNANKDTLGFLRQHLPRTSHGGDILFITRTESVGGVLAQSAANENSIIALETPLPNDAARLLLEDAGIDPALASSTDFAQAIELVKGVGCLPLAVDQAASFIRQKKTTVGDLLSLYRSERKSLVSLGPHRHWLHG